MKHITSYLFSKKFIVNSVLEFGPIGIFIFVFYIHGPYFATVILMISTLVSTFVTYQFEKRIPMVALYITFLTLVFGYLTLHRKNIGFLQIRDTVYDVTLALTIMLGFLLRKNILKIALHHAINLSNKVWDRLAMSWTVFFITAALLNEHVRRTYPIHTWLDYKIIMFVVTFVFGITTLYFFAKQEYVSEA